MAYTTINKSSEHFNTKTYSGSGSAQNIVTGTFQPDLIWVKSRSNDVSHVLTDAVRGIGKQIFSDTNGAETSWTNALTAFRSDGFTTDTGGETGQSGRTYVSWNWKAGTTSGQATNSYSTITPTSISFNQTSGFSIIKYTGNATAGAGVPHGLGVAPKMVITKNLDSSTYGWYCYHASLGATKSLYLHTSDAEVTSNDRWNGWVPDATNVSLGTNAGTNGANNMIMYCFAEKNGYSKIGSYTGNNNSNGTFVYTGFKPAFLLLKDSQSGQYWHMLDNKREPFNDNDAPHLSPNNSGSEATIRTDRGIANLDFLSNGFKFNTNNSGFNGTNKYIYMAFAEAPLVGSNNIPCTAR